MGNWLRQPMLSLLLLFSWLLLVDSFNSPGHWLFAVVLALLIPRLLHGWWSPAPKISNWRALLLFIWRTLVDIVLGNIQVAKMALGPQKHLQPGFIEFYTQLENDLAIFMLMSAISLAPGSVSTCFNPETRRIEVHLLHCENEQQELDGIRQRYEEVLQQVFV